MPDGSVYAVTAAAADSGGERVEMEFTLPGGSVSPPPHVHPLPVEEYEVLEGSLELMVGSEWHTLTAGQAASVPAGVLHTFRNRTAVPARVRNVHAPAERFEQYIEQICTVTRARGIRGGRDPRIAVYLSMITLEYPETLAPGRTRERLTMRALAGLGRVFGMKATSDG